MTDGRILPSAGVFKYHLQGERDLSIKDWSGWTFLDYVASLGRTKYARMLVKAGASISCTVFKTAFRFGHWETVREMLKEIPQIAENDKETHRLLSTNSCAPYARTMFHKPKD
jgi:ankyrin repeat protein